MTDTTLYKIIHFTGDWNSREGEGIFAEVIQGDADADEQERIYQALIDGGSGGFKAGPMLDIMRHERAMYVTLRKAVLDDKGVTPEFQVTSDCVMTTVQDTHDSACSCFCHEQSIKEYESL